MTASPRGWAFVVQRRVHSSLWSSPYANPWRALSRQVKGYDRAQLIVRIFYGCGLFLAVDSMSDWPALLRADAMAAPWPSAWIPADAVPGVVPWILGGYLGASALVAAVPTWRPARIVYFVLFMQYVSLISGFGGISHQNHTWLWISGLLIALPNRGWAKPTRLEDRHYFLGVVWVCQLVTMFFYMLTGFWKVVFGLHGVVTERASTFALDGFSVVVAQRDILFNDEPVLGRFFVDNPAIGWALFMGTIYIELAALNVAFRPRLHRAWGIMLVAFHIGTELAMGFTFPPNILVLALFFVCSPFAPDEVGARDAVLDLPGVHAARRALRRARDRPRGGGIPEPDGAAPEPVGVRSPVP
jgi:hypothetical protein